MGNKKIAELIAKGLRDGFTRPDQPNSAAILLPQFRTAGMPKEMIELATETATLLGEAIANLIETEGEVEMVAKDEIAQLREQARVVEHDSPRRIVPIHCRCDKDRSRPLAVLTVTDSPAVIIDGEQLIGSLAALTPECPHGRKAR